MSNNRDTLTHKVCRIRMERDLMDTLSDLAIKHDKPVSVIINQLLKQSLKKPR